MATALTVIAVLAALVLMTGLVLLWRLHALGRRVGSFECAMREGEHWHAGIAAYAKDDLTWYRVVSLSLRPSRRWARRDMWVHERRVREIEGGTSRVVEVHCHFGDEQFYLAARDHSLDGLVSWLEAGPPGPRTENV